MDPYSYTGGGNYDDEGRDRAALLSQMAGAPRSAPTGETASAVRYTPDMARSRGPYAPPGAVDEIRAQAPGASGTAPLPGPNSPYVAKGAAMAMRGFNADKIKDASHITPKYVFARAAKGLGMGDQDELLRRLKADPSGFFTNAEFFGNNNGKLRVNGDRHKLFGSAHSFDVINNAADGGEGWQFSDIHKPRPGVAPAVAMAAGPMGEAFSQTGKALFTDGQGDNSAFRKIMAQLQAMPQGQMVDEALDDDAIRALLAQRDPNHLSVAGFASDPDPVTGVRAY